MAAEGQRRPIGLAHLSLLDCAPPEFVEIAADAGFDFVGLRVLPVTPHEAPYDLSPGSALLRETIARLSHTGTTVRDIEFLLLDGSDQRGSWLRAFEAGQALGAASFTVACADTDLNRTRDTLARMAEDGRAFGVTPALEPISYQSVNSISAAASLARDAGCLVLIDALHLARFGGTPDQVSAISDLVPLVQLCDAPAASPGSRDALVTEARSARLAPGFGDLDPTAILQGLPRNVPISAEVPNAAAVERIGAQGWANRLYASCTTAAERAKEELS